MASNNLNLVEMANQIEEWIKLGIVDEEFTFNALELTKYPHLPIDTKYFKDLELDILAQFENLSKELNGVLIHSENYQALHTIKSRYNCSVKCIYIDPPFNTGDEVISIIWMDTKIQLGLA